MIGNTMKIALGTLVLIAGPLPAMAQNVPGHPRVNEVDQRLQDQQRREDAGVAQGQIGALGDARDTNVDARVSRRLSRDEALHGGHITKREDRQLNRELNRNSRRIYRQRHS